MHPGGEQASSGEPVASYRSFAPAPAWAGVGCDVGRWQRHADALRASVRRADPETWERVRSTFLRVAALDSSALAELTRPAPRLTTVVLRSALDDDDWASVVDAAGLVVECHRRALVVAADAATTGRPVDESLIGRLQDLIVESQQTYTVSAAGRGPVEVELPKRQYKTVSNFLLTSEHRLMPFAPAGRVPDEMQKLVGELATEDFLRLHPVVQAAFVHVSLVRIHPFADGNGRLARTLACLPLLREVGLPQLILADQWPAYIQALERCDTGDVTGVVEMFLAAQVDAMDLATSLLVAAATHSWPAVLSVRPADSDVQMLRDLVVVHARAAIGSPGPGGHTAVTRGTGDSQSVRVVVEDDGDVRTDVELYVEPDEVAGWLRVVSSAGHVFEVSRDEVHPAPVEIVHLRMRSWMDRLLAQGPHGLPQSTPVRGIFVLGSPRSGTTMVGNWVGSHPDVLRLAEYGGFYIAHSVAPGYLGRLPGGHHQEFLTGVRRLAGDHAAGAARREGRTWFCDATPWNLQVAGAIARDLPDAVFVLMLRHFSGAVLSLERFPWAGDSWADAARVWVELNSCIEQLPPERTIAVGYDVLTGHPAETVAGIREALASAGLDPTSYDDRELATSHAHIVGEPRPTIAAVVDGHLVFRPIPSLDVDRWTPEIHSQVWPVVADTHRVLLDRYGGVYEPPSRPPHVPPDQW